MDRSNRKIASCHTRKASLQDSVVGSCVAVESTREASKRFFRTRARVVSINPTTTRMVVSGRDVSIASVSITSYQLATGWPKTEFYKAFI